MPDRIDRRTTSMLQWTIRLGSLLVALFGAVVLADWAVWLLLPPDRAPPYPPMTPSTGIGLALCGSSLALLQFDCRRAVSVCALLLLLLAGGTIVLGILLHDDALTALLLGNRRPLRHGQPVHLAGTTALCLCLFGLGMLVMALNTRRRRLTLMASSLAGLGVTGLTLIAYAYQVVPPRGFGFYQDMSPHAATALFTLFLSSLLIEPERGWLVLLMSERASARATRAQMLLVITVPLLAGFVLLRGQRQGLISPGLAMAGMAVCIIVPLVVQILRDGRMLDDLETRRQTAVAETTRLGDELEQRVLDRTASLTQSEARLRGFVAQAADGLALIRLDRDGALSVETASPSLLGLYNDADARTLPVPVGLMLPDDVVSDLRQHIVTCLASGVPHHYRASRSTRGGPRVLDIILAPIKGDGAAGGDHLFAVSVRDVTNAEQREEQLRQSQKMEAVGQLTGGLAHDFNNLLAGISGSLEMIETRLAQGRTDGVDRYLNTAQEAGRRAGALTHRLLAFSRRQTLDPRPVEINRIIAGMEDLIRRTVGPAVTVIVRAAAPPWTSLIDPNQFENALLNLCLNARDAMPDGGRLTVTSFNDTVSEKHALPDLPPGDYVRVRVADTGIGMSPEVMARALDPFFTTKPIGQGTGLGLSMTYGFARQSGGRVELISEVGRGTSVDLRLPRKAGADAPAPPVADRITEPVAGGGRTVLVVDDEPAIRMLVRDILNERGYRTLEAEDGASGLELLRSAETIDLMVTDVGLPNGMNGRQLADTARTLRRTLPVLFITGYAETTVLGSGVLEPGMDVLTKPFTIGRLMGHVGALVWPASGSDSN